MVWLAGMRAVCIDTRFRYGAGAGLPPFGFAVLGSVYTVVEVNDYKYDHPRGTFLVLLELGDDDEWEAEHFRPVKNTDISIFHQMLVPSPRVRA